jgi:tripartite-type tricarboxylate transporter receptor subunit TctC
LQSLEFNSIKETAMMKMIRRFACIAMAFSFSLTAHAQTYPTKPVRIIVPYAAGQGTDVVTRHIAAQLAKALGQPFIVENRGGAGGNIGADVGAKAAPDGYTLTMGTNATHSMNQYLYPSVSFDAEKDFAPVILVGMLPMVISANPGFHANSVAELIAMAKAKPDRIDVALPSTTSRIVFELLKDRSKAPLFPVPYKSSASAMIEVVGGTPPLTIDTVTATQSQVAGGKLKPLAITSRASSELMPGVKSVAEQGIPDFEVTAWNALYAPRGTPESIIRQLNSELTKILAQPETRQRLLQLGFEPGGGTPQQLEELGRSEREKWGKLIKAAGLRAD